MKQNVKQSLDDYDTLGFIEMDETDGIERLIFFEQYLKKLRHEREDFFKVKTHYIGTARIIKFVI